MKWESLVRMSIRLPKKQMPPQTSAEMVLSIHLMNQLKHPAVEWRVRANWTTWADKV